MSMLWEKAVIEVEKLKEQLSKLSEELIKDKDIFDSIANKKLAEIKFDRIRADLKISSGKVSQVTYILPIKPNNRNMFIIGGIIARNLPNGKLTCTSDWKGEIHNIAAYSDNRELLFYVSKFFGHARNLPKLL